MASKGSLNYIELFVQKLSSRAVGNSEQELARSWPAGVYLSVQAPKRPGREWLPTIGAGIRPQAATVMPATRASQPGWGRRECGLSRSRPRYEALSLKFPKLRQSRYKPKIPNPQDSKTSLRVSRRILLLHCSLRVSPNSTASWVASLRDESLESLECGIQASPGRTFVLPKARPRRN